MVPLKKIEEAAQRLEGVASLTPLQYSKRLSKQLGAEVFLKREDLQEVRSFKIRGAYNKIAQLSNAERGRGVVCASAGNHAQGVAYGCAKLKIKGTIFMPVVTPNQKIEKVKSFGGKYIDVVLTGATYDDAVAESKKFCKRHKNVYIPAFDDYDVIAGQGTIGKEIYDQMNGDVDAIFVAIGGGGMISGIGSYFKQINPATKIIGVESKNQASMSEALKKGSVVTLSEIDTFADGTAVKTAGEKTLAICKEVVDEVVLTEEGQIATDMISLFQNEGIVAEPAGAMALSGPNLSKKSLKGKRIVCIICGGNNDILRYPEVLERSLVYLGRKHYFILEFAQKPGQLKRFVNEALGQTDDITRFEYIKKNNKESGPALVGIEIAHKDDLKQLLKRMDKIGLKYSLLDSGSMLYKYLV